MINITKFFKTSHLVRTAVWFAFLRLFNVWILSLLLPSICCDITRGVGPGKPLYE